MRIRNRPAAGFSLLELLAVITIMGILAATVVSRVSIQAYEAKRKTCWRYRRDLNNAMEHYYFEHGAHATDVSDLHPAHYPDTIPICPITNSGYTIDSTTNRVQGHDH